ncbi:D-alanine--D-alanyl carrier protein ligase [Streptomyces tendae]
MLSVPEIQASGVSDAAPRVPVAPGQAAYIYFTSGSTGAPKGALCEHAGMLNHLHMKLDDMEMTNGTAEVVTQTASQCFDISLWQFAAPLMVGGSVRVVDTDALLGVPLERIGRDDNFFDLGGTSLAAVRLLVQLDRALSLKDLVAHPVLADLGRVLDERARGGERVAAENLLQPLANARDAHHTLVCFPYAGGNAVNFRSLAAELERDGIAVLGVELPGHDFAGGDDPMADVPEIARRVRDEIAARVTTPVLLWGHCAGAAPALETARLLQEAGRPAERVFVGALLLEDIGALRAEMAEASEADNRTLLSRLRADNAYVELDELKPERADVVGRAYRHRRPDGQQPPDPDP